MRRLFPLAALLFPVTFLVAAPVPKDFEAPAKKLERLFGTPHQPDDTKVELVGNVLKVSVPELPAGKPGEAGVFASPHTERLVAGDFELSVRVTVDVPNGATVDSWAGIFVGFNDKHHFDYMRWLNDQPNRKAGPRGRGVWSQLCTPNQTNVVGHAERDTATATLRIVRKGSDLTASTKYGDSDWSQEVRATATLPNEVTVGVYVGGRKGPLTAEFENLTVTKAK